MEKSLTVPQKVKDFLVVQLVRNLPAMQETLIQFLGGEDPVGKGKASPVFWPGEFHGLYGSGNRKELDTNR